MFSVFLALSANWTLKNSKMCLTKTPVRILLMLCVLLRGVTMRPLLTGRATTESDSPAQSEESLLSLEDDESFRSDMSNPSSISHMCRNECTVGRDIVVKSANNSVHWTADICSTASVEKILDSLEDNIQRLLVFCARCVCGNRTHVTYWNDKTTSKIQKRDVFAGYQRRFAAAAPYPSEVDLETSPSEQYSVYLRIRNQEEPPKFSQPYDPRTSTASSGFVPVKGPPIRAIENSRTLGRTKQWSPREAKSSVTLPRSESIQERRSSARHDDDGESNLPWWSAERFSSKRLRSGRDGADTSGSAKTKEKSPPERSRSRRKRIKQREGVTKSPGKSKKAYGEKLTDASKDDEYQFSSIYDPKRNTSSSGFIPIPAPHRPTKIHNRSRLGPKTTPKPKKEEKPSKIVRKESYGNEELLGDGNFEIITGGLFLDPDDNEIVRQFGLKSYKRKKFRKFVPSRDFHYPKYFWGDSPSEHAMTLPMSYDVY